MQWHKDNRTGIWLAERDEHKLRIQRGTWGNSTDPAWKIWINGNNHGTELTIRDAKLEAERELNILMSRENF